MATQYVVAKGHAITTSRGVKGPGEAVSAKDFNPSVHKDVEQILTNLFTAGHLEVEAPVVAKPAPKVAEATKPKVSEETKAPKAPVMPTVPTAGATRA